MTDIIFLNFECAFHNNNAMTIINKILYIKKIDQFYSPENPLSNRSSQGFILIKNKQ